MARLGLARPQDLLEIRSAYLRAIAEGDDELVIECAFGRAGAPGEPVSGSLDLAPGNATALPPIDVTFRGAPGATVISGIPLAIAARSVHVEDVAFIGVPAPALGVTASASVTLAGVTVLDATAAPHWSRGALEVTASGNDGTRLSARGLVVGGGGAHTAALALAGRDGGWFPEIELEDVTLAAEEASAALAVNGVRRLRAGRLRLRAVECLLRLGVPALDAALTGAVLANESGVALLEVLTPLPGDSAPPVRVGGESLLAARPHAEEAASLALDDSCRIDASAVAAAIDGVLARARAGA